MRQVLPLDVIVKRFDAPDEIRNFSKGRFEVVRIGGFAIGRATYEPGWRWSEHVGPLVSASRCVVEHVGLVIAGAATAAFEDGRIVKLCAGDAFYIPAIPHDSWVLGDEPYVSLHLLGTERYATREGETREGRMDGDADAHSFVCGWANTSSLGKVVLFNSPYLDLVKVPPSRYSRLAVDGLPKLERHESWVGPVIVESIQDNW